MTESKGEAEVSAGLLRELQGHCKAAVAKLGQLESAEQERKALAARLESLVSAEVAARAEAQEQRRRAEDLSAEVRELERRLMWRTISLEVSLVGVALIAAMIAFTHWYPW